VQFSLNSEQELLRATVRQFFDVVVPLQAVRRRTDDPGQATTSAWQRMCGELGLPGLTVDEKFGGMGGGHVELAVVMEEAGRALITEPLFASAVLAGSLLRHVHDDSAAARYLPGIADGTTVGTVAVVDDSGDWDLATVATRAVQQDGQYRLTGSKAFVAHGECADLLLVVARTDLGLSVFAVESNADGLERIAEPVLDRTRPLASLRLQGVVGDLIGNDGQADEAVRCMVDDAAIALAAEQLGGAQRCLEMAVEYARTRRAFGKPIGSFQAIAHKCASLFLNIEAARSALYHAAWSASAGRSDVRLLAASSKAACGEIYAKAAAENIQIHGAIGFTWEHDAHLYLRRAHASRELFGSPERDYEQVAQMIGL
jgi:alkylation response protein AidB-like acyl-CoA dehydrogenase